MRFLNTQILLSIQWPRQANYEGVLTHLSLAVARLLFVSGVARRVRVVRTAPGDTISEGWHQMKNTEQTLLGPVVFQKRITDHR
jgi:hypothetical protein